MPNPTNTEVKFTLEEIKNAANNLDNALRIHPTLMFKAMNSLLEATHDAMNDKSQPKDTRLMAGVRLSIYMNVTDALHDSGLTTADDEDLELLATLAMKELSKR